MTFKEELKEIGTDIKEIAIEVKNKGKKLINIITTPLSLGATIGIATGYGYYNSNEGINYRTLAIGGTLTLVYGTFAYLTGRWPFTEIDRQEYQPLQWFNEEKGPVIEGPGTRWYVYPIIKKVRREGKIVTIPAYGQERSCDIKFITKDGLNGMLKTQYLWLVPTKEDAEQFFWKWNAQSSLIDEVIKGELSRRIGRINGLENSIQSGEYIDENNNKIDYIVEAEREANKELKRIGLGVEVKDFSILDIEYSESAQGIINLVSRAKQTKEARIHEAEGKARATIIQAQATEINANKYRDAAQAFFEEGAHEETIVAVALYLADMDNNQEIAESEGNIVKVTGLAQQFPAFFPFMKKKIDRDKE